MENKYLSDSELVEEIKRYIHEEGYNYAILIDGVWGSGKTYFVKNVLLQKLEEKDRERIIYISLYGIESIESISKQLYIEFIAKKSKLGNKAIQGLDITFGVGSLLGGAIKPFIGKFGDIIIEDNEVSNLIEKLVPLKDQILIFDDLERCHCTIQEILGFINGFVEQSNMKVIIVANQKEIEIKQKNSELALQYLSILDKDESVDYEENKLANILAIQAGRKNSDKKNTEKKVAIEELEERRKRLFSEESKYERIKEKVVGVTFYYKPDIKNVLVKIIEGKKLVDELQQLLYTYLNFIVEVMEKYEHFNFRTFQFFLIKIERVFSIIKQQNYRCRQETFKEIILCCWRSCVVFKAHEGLYKWQKNEEFGYKLQGKNLGLSMKVIDEFIVNGILNENDLIRVSKQYDEDEYIKNSKNNGAFSKLYYNWISYPELKVKEYMNEVVEDIQTGEYNVNSFGEIILLFLRIEKTGIGAELLDKALKNMSIQLEQLPNKEEIRLNQAALDDEKEIVGRYKEKIAQLNNKIRVLSYNQFMERFDKCVQTEKWTDSFTEFVIQNKDTIHIYGFFSLINTEKLLKKINIAMPDELQIIRKVFISLYPDNVIYQTSEDERTKMADFAIRLKKLHKDDRIAAYQVRLLYEYIESTIKRLEKYYDNE